MFSAPFPTVHDWVTANLSPADQAAFREYLYGVEYHLRSAEQASQDCSSTLWRFQWILNSDRKSVFILGLSPEHLIQFGDKAIREAASTLDTSLLLINHSLALGLDNSKVSWRRPPEKSSLRERLQNLPNGRGEELLRHVDAVFGSIGYSLLQGYRNWVTHRGAPRTIIPPHLEDPIPLPKEVGEVEEPGKRDFLIQTHLLSKIPAEIHVQCWAVVPPVQSVINATIDEAESDISLPGITIARGARNITIRDARIVSGALTEDAEVFRTKNPILIEKHKAPFAGEELAVYTAMDYVHAVGSVVRFAEAVVTGELDAELEKACKSNSRKAR